LRGLIRGIEAFIHYLPVDKWYTPVHDIVRIRSDSFSLIIGEAPLDKVLQALHDDEEASKCAYCNRL